MFLAVRVTLLGVFLTLFATFPALPAQGLSEPDLQAARTALAAAQSGDWPRAYASAAAIGDPLPLKIVRWLDYSRPGAPGRFADIAEFIEKNPDWPRQKALRRHAEEALTGESDAVAADWFRRHPPVSGVGKVREAEIMLTSGDLAPARGTTSRAPGNSASRSSSSVATASGAVSLTGARRDRPAGD